MLNKLLDKRIVGFWLVIIFDSVFRLVAVRLSGYFEGTEWFLVSSLQRALFGIVALGLFIKCFDKRNWKEVIGFKGVGKGLVAGSGVIFFTLYLVVYIAIGSTRMNGLTLSLIISHLICQQLTTGFYEEVIYRGFVLEGYFSQKKQDVFKRIGYASMSFIIFGLAHAIEQASLGQGIYMFITTGILGFAFAAVYLYSHNMLVVMILHALYDIPANLLRYVEWNNAPVKLALDSMYNYVFVFVFVVALIFVIKSEQDKVSVL